MFISKHFCSCNLDWSVPKPYVRSALTNVKCIRLGVPFWINFINHCGIQFAIPFFWCPFVAIKINFQRGPAKRKNKTRYQAQPPVRQQHEDIVRDIQKSEQHANKILLHAPCRTTLPPQQQQTNIWDSEDRRRGEINVKELLFHNAYGMTFPPQH